MFRQLSLKSSRGFTLIEVMVVVSIVGILASVIGINAVDSGRQGRDAERQADLRTLQSAIELYKNKYGRYPEGCRGADQWSGQQGSSFACTGGSSQYIIGHVDVYDFDGDGNTTERFSFAPEFIPVLPVDPRLHSTLTNSGYVYRTNAAGTVYKLMAMNTVEGEVVDYTHEFKSCDIRPNASGGLQNLGAGGVDTSGWCTIATRAALEPTGSPVTTVEQIPHCRMDNGLDNGNGRFERSYGVWGGFLPLAVGINQASRVRDTTAVICK